MKNKTQKNETPLHTVMSTLPRLSCEELNFIKQVVDRIHGVREFYTFPSEARAETS